MEIFSYMAIISILLTGIIPMAGGIIQTMKENRQLDRERTLKETGLK
jgi:type II secretory pathway pseudopilin PulG